MKTKVKRLVLVNSVKGLTDQNLSLLRTFGDSIISVLNSSHLKDEDPILYFRLKDNAVELANLGEH